MLVEQIMSREVQTCRAEDTLDRAAQLMWDRDCGCLPVLKSDDASRVMGLITDRDICMCAHFQGKPLHELHVSEAMSRQVQACKATDAAKNAEKLMSEARVRRLPVIDEAGSLIGVISLADLAREAMRELERSQPELTESEIGDTLAAICQPPPSTGGSGKPSIGRS